MSPESFAARASPSFARRSSTRARWSGRCGRRGAAAQPRSFFDSSNQWAREQGAPGLGYVVARPRARPRDRSRSSWTSRGWPRSRRPPAQPTATRCSSSATQRAAAERLAGRARVKLGEDLDLVEKNAFRFCWIVDFPMYERNEDTGKIEFSHNPFSMPQGGLRGAGDAGSADDQGLPVRHRVQRRRAVERRHPQPPARDHVQGLRHRRLQRARTWRPASAAC